MNINNELSKAIQDAVTETVLYGSGNIKLDDNVTIQGEWETMEGKDGWDVVTIYIYRDNVMVFDYQCPITAVKN